MKGNCASYKSINIFIQSNMSPSAHPEVRGTFLKPWCSAVCCLVWLTEDVVPRKALLNLCRSQQQFQVSWELRVGNGGVCESDLSNHALNFCSTLLDFVGKEWYNLLHILSTQRSLCSCSWIFKCCHSTLWSCCCRGRLWGLSWGWRDGKLCTGCFQERMYYLLPKAHLLFLTLKTG